MTNGIFELLRSDGSIVVNKKLAHKIGLNEAILYSELISRYLYFKNKNQLTVDGFFFNTVEDLKQGTTLGKSPQLKAVRKLESLNLISTDLRGLPAVRHFKPNLDTTIILNLLNEEVKKNPEQLDNNGPQRSRAEGEQNVSTSNDTSISKEKKKVNKKPNKDSNFEKLWALYPLKKGKNHIKQEIKEEINNYHNLEELKNIMKEYLDDKQLEINGGFKRLKNGSTFFNGLLKKEKEIEEIKNTKIVEVEGMKVEEVNEVKKSKNILF